VKNFHTHPTAALGKANMAPGTHTRSKSAPKPEIKDNDHPSPTPGKEPKRTPPMGPAVAGTPLTTRPERTKSDNAPCPTIQPEEPHTAQVKKGKAPSAGNVEPRQSAEHKITAKEAKQALDGPLNYIYNAYQTKLANLSQGEDINTTNIEIPSRALNDIGRSLIHLQTYFTQQKTEIDELAKHQEQVIKETIKTSNAQMLKETIIKETTAAIVKETITTAIKETIETTIDEKIASIEAIMKETIATTIKETVERIDMKTYATVTETPAVVAQTTRINHIREIQQRNQEQREQRRRENNKFEVTLTTQDADPTTKEKLQQQTHAEITAKLQQMMDNQVKENPPQIHGIMKLTKSQDIHITYSTEQETEVLRNLRWDKYYKGLMTRQTKYGIVVAGISTKTIDPNKLDNPELIKQLEDQNKTIGLKILKMKPLQCKLKENDEQFSLIIFTPQPDIANLGIKKDIYYNNEKFPRMEKYSPQLQLIQCYKCNQLGHHVSKCRSPDPICGKCNEHHLTSECQTEIRKCALCQGDHGAIMPNYPAETTERQRLLIRKRNTPSYFNEQ
jgi:hypothetical protein